MPGTFAEYYRVREDRTRLLPDEISFQVASLCEPVCVCLEALEQAFPRQLKPVIGNSLLILGDGPFGVLMARVAECLNEAYWLESIAIAGLVEFRLAKAFPVRSVNIHNLADPVQTLLEANDGKKYQAAILAVGSSKALADAP